MTADGVHERYDRGARMWRVTTWQIAYSLRHRYVGTGHYALALLMVPPGYVQITSPGYHILTHLGGDLDSMRRHAMAVLGGRERDMAPIGDIAKRVKRGPTTTRQAQSLHTAFLADPKPSVPITTAHILLALTDPKHPDPPLAGSRDRFGLRRNAVPSFYDIGQRLLDAFAPLEAIHQAAQSAVDGLDAAFASAAAAAAAQAEGPAAET